MSTAQAPNAAASPEATASSSIHGQQINPQTSTTQNWYAWNNRMPPGPPSFHIVGDVQVPNPGVEVFLTEHHPQGINPADILLDLHYYQRPGIWNQMVVWKHVHYEKARAHYARAIVLSGGSVVADIPVHDIF
jgi:hypothetical protein